MREDSHLQPAYSMTTLYCPARAHPDWKGLDQDNLGVFLHEEALHACCFKFQGCNAMVFFFYVALHL